MMTRRWRSIMAIAGAFVVAGAGPAWACGGLVAPNGAVQLLRTSTLAAYHDGVEHYVTSFQFAGGKGEFGSIVPLPGVPSRVVRGGDWTLQRLQQEVAPVTRIAFDSGGESPAAAASRAQVILTKSIDALDITVLTGGGEDVARWAEEHGFDLSDDAPEVLDFYARRSPVFMAARFDARAAEQRGFAAGDGTPVHLEIPTPSPWVPLRILSLAKADAEIVEADVFLLTDRRPALLPHVGEDRGLFLERSEPASRDLLADLASDRGMGWLPRDGMWLSYLRVNAPAGDLRFDLAVDASGLDRPSPIAAGLVLPEIFSDDSEGAPVWFWVASIVSGVGVLVFVNRVIGSRG